MLEEGGLGVETRADQVMYLRISPQRKGSSRRIGSDRGETWGHEAAHSVPRRPRPPPAVAFLPSMDLLGQGDTKLGFMRLVWIWLVAFTEKRTIE